MKKILVFTISLLIQVYSFGQSKLIQLLDKGDSIENLIPDKWKILSSVNGDLNKDGISDIAFVIENTDTKNIELNESGLGRDTINLNPRILGIYFRNQKGKLIKKLQSNEFIILQNSPTMDEPFDGVKILKNGVLKIDFKFWYSAGSWSMSYHTYKFRFQNNKFELVAYKAEESHRGTNESTDYNINFLTGKMRIIKTTFDENKIRKYEEENKDFILKQLKSIQSLRKPFEWEFNGIYL